MLLKAIKQAVNKSTRRKVELRLTDGSTVNVPHPDFVFYSPVPIEQAFIVWNQEGGYSIIDADEVAKIDVSTRTKANAHK